MSSQTPTYNQFRDFALSHGHTGRTLAPHVEADEPVKTATRILVFLAGTRWDEEPLPYPKLCRLYHGMEETEAIKPAKPKFPASIPLRDSCASYRIDDDSQSRLYVTTSDRTLWDSLAGLCNDAGGYHIQDTNIFCYPYEALCRMAGSQQRALDEAREALKSSDSLPSRTCPCGQNLTGPARQLFCSPRCRKRASRANPRRTAKTRGSRSVTATHCSHPGDVTLCSGEQTARRKR
jgi:hypothetical protein